MNVDKSILEEFDPLNEKNNTKQTESEVQHASKNGTTIQTDPEPTSTVVTTTDQDLDSTFFDFKLFIKQLKTSQADPIVRYTRSFLNNYITQRPLWTVSEQIKLITDFKNFIYEKFHHFEPFKSLNNQEFKNAQEGMEKLVMSKLYFHCFTPILKQTLKIDLDEEHQKDLIDDERLDSKIKEYRFIELTNLEDNLLSNSTTIHTKSWKKFIDLGCEELNKVNKYKSPRDKIICILNCCKIIYGLLRNHHNKQDSQSTSNTNTAGADSFMPLLIYMVLKSNVPHLLSNIRYIERFRYTSLNRGEELYYLSSLQGAISFILDMTKESLHIEDELKFQSNYDNNQMAVKQEENETKAREKQAQLEMTKQQDLQQRVPSLDDLTNSMATMFNDFLSSYNSSNTNSQNATPQRDTSRNNTPETDREMSKLIEELEERDRRNTQKTMESMFPDVDPEIIADVCTAKNFNVGQCVDTLLALFD